MSGTELDITVDGALTGEVISGERAAFCSPLEKGRPIVEHYIMHASTKGSKERQNIIDSAKVLSLAMKPYSTSLSAFRSRLLLHDSHNEVELSWAWLFNCPRRSETFCFKFMMSASAAATSSRSALVFNQHSKKKLLQMVKKLSTAIARFRKGTLLSIVDGKDTCPLRIFINPDSNEALKFLSFCSWSRKFSTC